MDRTFWNNLSLASKWGLAIGVALILGVTVTVAALLLKVDYQILFADLKPQDSAVMVAELDRLKIPYRLDDGGNTILVEKEAVHATRLKLLGKDLPLHGAIGFELFNNSDFGMTEFAQKINYQRALQGEITRTIMSLDEIKDVRVHLAMPEEGLFKRASSKAKAAINIALKPGKKLRAEQVNGIQRLVAASVPGILAQDVTIVDQQGIALTRTGTQEFEVSSASLDLKRDTESLLNKKANGVLEQMFGSGQALASVDVVLDMDQIKTTTEDVLAAPPLSGQASTGVIVKEREMSRDNAAPLDAISSSQGVKQSSVNREVDYQVGRRVEQVISQPGAIRKISVVAVIQKHLDAEQSEKLRSLVATAVGASVERGDSIVVQHIFSPRDGGLEANLSNLSSEPGNVGATKELGHESIRENGGERKSAVMTNPAFQLLILLVVIAIVMLAVLLFLNARTNSNAHSARLSDKEKEAALKQIRVWLNKDSALESVPDLATRHTQD
ncbi:flagellar basal-body MS-ring/collar protein FliF [Undibacterium flavidum]|uniref:Flagellar M-ring protein n=1 Tax=Undibacterium flavidum TaxID=2762297 RepID=A0ABR6YER4_9BURK|nr:flagellar basal-body MS-ring/collar protein FliF [Undibacterium flavidum]MBC3875061.1 flagellar M-ring protein FliF [Undibacterium flavidum]